MTWWMAIVKTKTTNILCLCSSIVFLSRKQKKKKQRESKKQGKNMKKKKERKTKYNLLLSYMNLTFLLIEPSNWTLCLYTHSLYLTKKCFLNVKKGPI